MFLERLQTTTVAQCQIPHALQQSHLDMTQQEAAVHTKAHPPAKPRAILSEAILDPLTADHPVRGFFWKKLSRVA